MPRVKNEPAPEPAPEPQTEEQVEQVEQVERKRHPKWTPERIKRFSETSR